jgi:hypothetical protein
VNPKDMTNKESLRKISQIGFGLGNNKKTNSELLDEFSSVYDELLRRLDEADALRKENEGLRKDKARLDLIESLGGHLLAVSCDIVIDCLASRAREKIDELLRSNEKSILINEQAS